MEQREEVKELSRITDRLYARHPGMPREVVDAVVRDVHDGYARSRVRDFVPLLVEREARERLRAESSTPVLATG